MMRGQGWRAQATTPVDKRCEQVMMKFDLAIHCTTGQHGVTKVACGLVVTHWMFNVDRRKGLGFAFNILHQCPTRVQHPKHFGLLVTVVKKIRASVAAVSGHMEGRWECCEHVDCLYSHAQQGPGQPHQHLTAMWGTYEGRV
ncbi:hypothetical protein C0Q70_18793 [Pomacea canaliculata]|uniref:Uncharacterized protein n=1 Tax=Pomacea canaliculata TaxID=400727 RepID=A0A2T7NHK4_POMCA|nr:hypothetical protein C0Q70_18793 [Pomacea canaliculata]